MFEQWRDPDVTYTLQWSHYVIVIKEKHAAVLNLETPPISDLRAEVDKHPFR